MFQGMMVDFPAGSNSVALRLHDIDKIIPAGEGAEIKTWSGNAYISENVADATRRVIRAARAENAAYIEYMASMRRAGI